MCLLNYSGHPNGHQSSAPSRPQPPSGVSKAAHCCCTGRRQAGAGVRRCDADRAHLAGSRRRWRRCWPPGGRLLQHGPHRSRCSSRPPGLRELVGAPGPDADELARGDAPREGRAGALPGWGGPLVWGVGAWAEAERLHPCHARARSHCVGGPPPDPGIWPPTPAQRPHGAKRSPGRTGTGARLPTPSAPAVRTRPFHAPHNEVAELELNVFICAVGWPRAAKALLPAPSLPAASGPRLPPHLYWALP